MQRWGDHCGCNFGFFVVSKLKLSLIGILPFLYGIYLAVD